MEFRDATDILFDRIDHDDLAKLLGISVATIRQARLKNEAIAHRSPPQGWEAAASKLVKTRIAHLQSLLLALDKPLTSSSISRARGISILDAGLVISSSVKGVA